MYWSSRVSASGVAQICSSEMRPPKGWRRITLAQSRAPRWIHLVCNCRRWFSIERTCTCCCQNRLATIEIASVVRSKAVITATPRWRAG